MLAALVDFLIDPLHIIYMLMVVSVGLLLRKKKKGFQRVVLFIFAVLILSTVSIIPKFLCKQLEKKYIPLHALENIPDSIHIVVLGSGHVADPDLPSTMQLAEPAINRMMEGMRIHQRVEKSVLIFTGFEYRSSQSHPIVQRNASLEMGIDSAKIKVILSTEDTYQEVIQYKKIYGSNIPIILVTSAMHMPRAMYLFQINGLNPIPAPCDFKIREDPHDKVFPVSISAKNMQLIRLALHEYLGMWYAKMMY